jgi:hypothetical protein
LNRLSDDSRTEQPETDLSALLWGCHERQRRKAI